MTVAVRIGAWARRCSSSCRADRVQEGRCLGALLDDVEDGVRNSILSASNRMYNHYHDSDNGISIRQMLASRLASILAQPHPRTTSCRFGTKSSPRRYWAPNQEVQVESGVASQALWMVISILRYVYESPSGQDFWERLVDMVSTWYN